MNKTLAFLATQRIEYQRRAIALNRALSDLVEKGFALERELEELTQAWGVVPSRVREAFSNGYWDLPEEEESLYLPLWTAMGEAAEELSRVRFERNELEFQFQTVVDFLEFCHKAGL